METSTCNIGNSLEGAINRKERSRTMEAFNKYRKIMRVAERLERPYEAGLNWYPKATDRIKILADRINCEVDDVAGCAAWLSPMTSWEQNMAGVNALVTAVQDDYPHEWMAEVASRYTTYYGNGVKAIRCLRGDGELSGPKVTAFAHNLGGNLNHVTVDSWMFRIVGKFGLNGDSPTDNARRAIDRAVRMIATLHGIEPAQAQAIIWTTSRDWNA